MISVKSAKYGGQLDKRTATSFQINSLNSQTYVKEGSDRGKQNEFTGQFWTVCAVELISLNKTSGSRAQQGLYYT